MTLIKIEKIVNDKSEVKNINKKDLSFYENFGWKKVTDETHFVKKGKKRTEEEM